jgi:toxin ParE1/3/4
MTKRRVVFRRKAEEDIEDIAYYIAQDNVRAAEAFREALENACFLLAERPEIGPLRSFGNPRLSDVRLWPIRGFERYLLFYRVAGDTLDVIRVVHGARDLPALFEETEPEE